MKPFPRLNEVGPGSLLKVFQSGPEENVSVTGVPAGAAPGSSKAATSVAIARGAEARDRFLMAPSVPSPTGYSR